MKWFNCCKELNQVNLKNASSLSSISIETFNYCVKLKNIFISSSVHSIGDKAFFSCLSLNQIFFEAHSTLTFIGSYAFGECIGSKEIIIPSSVITLGKNSFIKCRELINVTFESPSSLLTIGSGSFKQCSKLNPVIFESQKPIDYTINDKINQLLNHWFLDCKIFSIADNHFPQKKIILYNS